MVNIKSLFAAILAVSLTEATTLGRWSMSDQVEEDNAEARAADLHARRNHCDVMCPKQGKDSCLHWYHSQRACAWNYRWNTCHEMKGTDYCVTVRGEKYVSNLTTEFP